MRRIAILGSTGSIGTQALDVVARHPDRFRVVALAAGGNADLLEQQVRSFRPSLVSLADADAARDFARRAGAGTRVADGAKGALEVATHPDVDLVLAAIVGAAGLEPTLGALEAGTPVALANKESMVIAGPIMNAAAARSGARILPVDSEHSAIFQSLASGRRSELRRVLLTASGGPFRDWPRERLRYARVEQALRHPNWDMGAKVTIDSATLMNKGLELIEAVHLFQVEPDQVEVHVHPQSIVHSMVEFVDGSVIAQLGVPDMRAAIAYALAHPDRIETGVAPLDLFEVATLGFERPDPERFRCLALAQAAARLGGSAPAVLNAANEVAVAAFLDGAIGFLQIAAVVEDALDAHRARSLERLEQVAAADRWARARARARVAALGA